MASLINGNGNNFNKNTLQQQEWGIKYNDVITGTTDNNARIIILSDSYLQKDKKYTVVVNGIKYNDMIVGENTDLHELYIGNYLCEENSEYDFYITTGFSDSNYTKSQVTGFGFVSLEHANEEISLSISGIKEKKYNKIDTRLIKSSFITNFTTDSNLVLVGGTSNPSIYTLSYTDDDLYNLICIPQKESDIMLNDLIYDKKLGHPITIVDNKLYFMHMGSNYGTSYYAVYDITINNSTMPSI